MVIALTREPGPAPPRSAVSTGTGCAVGKSPRIASTTLPATRNPIGSVSATSTRATSVTTVTAAARAPRLMPIDAGRLLATLIRRLLLGPAPPLVLAAAGA